MPDTAEHKRLPIVVMGVSGSGKSTLGAALAQALHLPFVEGDALHDARNIDRMRSGQPLGDADRAGWLARIATHLHDEQRYPLGVIVTCSALKRAYRDQLRRATRGLRFLFLQVGEPTALQRLQHRPGHYMPPSLVPSQFAALEPPAADETDVVTLDAQAPPAQVLSAALKAVAATEPRATGIP